VRCLQILPQSSKTVLSGSYDQNVNLFDLNQDGNGTVFKHGAPVEALACLPSGFGFVSVGGYTVLIIFINSRPNSGTSALRKYSTKLPTTKKQLPIATSFPAGIAF
jgi:hypothetical protein